LVCLFIFLFFDFLIYSYTKPPALVE